MVVLKNNPVGIDAALQPLQEALHEHLLSLWQLPGADYRCYGRAYRNQKAEGYIPEVYVGGNEYREVYVDDSVAVISFFGYERGKFLKQNEADVSLIFAANLNSLKPAILHRADEEVRNDVFNFLVDAVGNLNTPIATITGIANVYAEYTGYRSIESIKLRDMHPFHCFRFNFILRYGNYLDC